jgi:hypothetical protein
MDIQNLKINLARKILITKNEDMLLEIDKIIQEKGEEDWWDELPKEVQDSIAEGIRDIEEGRVYTHEEVMREAKKKYGI